MHRNSTTIAKRSSLVLCSILTAMVLVISFPKLSLSQSLPNPSYTIVSASASELTVHIHPQYTRTEVSDPLRGDRYLDISFGGSSLPPTVQPGQPAERELDLSMLVAASNEQPVIEVVSRSSKTIDGFIAPAPTGKPKQGALLAEFIRDPEAYAAHRPVAEVSVAPAQIIRTAYSCDLVIHPVSADFESKKITLVTDMVVKVRFTHHGATAVSVSDQDRAYYRAMFINGTVSQFYNSATGDLSRPIVSERAANKVSAVAGVSGEQWLSVTTTDEGVYKITAADLAKAGISSADASTIALYGYGAKMLPEAVDSLTGQLRECAIDVKTNSDGSFKEMTFFAAGPAEWHYVSWQDRQYGLYHFFNPFTTSGHFLLKTGGAQAAKRISVKGDVLNDTAIITPATRVQSVVLHERDLLFEEASTHTSREMMGEQIPLGSTISVTLPPMPGYLPDSTIIRPGFNAHAVLAKTFSLSLDGKDIGTVSDPSTTDPYEPPYTSRRWDNSFLLGTTASVPTSLTIGLASNDNTAKAWLNWIEVFYKRSLSLLSAPALFLQYGDANNYHYTFTDASEGALWDITDVTNVRALATASGPNIDVTVKAPETDVRRFIAFTPSQTLSPQLAATTAPNLRQSICSEGATEIIITPQAFLDEANRYAAQRRAGGQATEPMSVKVVTIEDIYREFGYGSHDAVAIRDFLRASITYSAASGGTIPLYVLLFGGGHVDYQNRTTQLPVNIPVYETWYSQPLSIGSYRSAEPLYSDPDDGFYARLTSGYAPSIAIGRIVANTVEDIATITDKVIRYETKSDKGIWRSKASFICDDRHGENASYDLLDHIVDTENEVDQVADRILIEKIYGQAFPDVITTGGLRKTGMEAAIVNTFNSGSAVISYIGHGNPTVWAHEGILNVPSTINKFTNTNKLAFVTTATCDFSTFDDYAAVTSGGVQMLQKPDGGAIGLFATSRSVFGGDDFPTRFYNALYTTPCDGLVGSAPVGIAYQIARKAGSFFSTNLPKYYILGDPAQRVIIPRQYVVIDSLNGQGYDANGAVPTTISALSLLEISGHISNSCDGSDLDHTFNGSTTVTLYDAPTLVSAISTFNDRPPMTDRWWTNGPILYSGAATVAGGRFHTSFVVSKDIKFDSSNARLSMLAYDSTDRSALGVATNLRVFGIDTSRIQSDHAGPGLKIYIGSRAFHSGDVVPLHSDIIVDVKDLSGLNTSTSSIGHSFTGWFDDSTAGMIDLAEHYVAEPNNFASGTTITPSTLPLGRHLLRVRAFDAAGNPASGEVEFVAKGDNPYELYNTTLIPNPVSTNGTFTFEQPASPDVPVDVTLDIYTAIGQRTRTIEVPGVSANTITIPFDCKDDGGGTLIDGMYLYRLTARQRLSGVTTTSGGKFIVLHQQ